MAAYLPKISTTYNNHGATKNFQCPDKPLHRKAFRASFTLSAAGHITAGNPVLGCQFPLCPRGLSVQAIALTDNVRLTGRQALVHQLPNSDMTLPGVQVVQHGVLYAHNVHEEEIVAVLVCLQGF